MNREDAIGKMKRALDDYRIAGVETTIPFCRFVMDHPNFVSGDFNNDFVNTHYKPEYLSPVDDRVALVAALTAVALSEADNNSGYRNNHNGNDRQHCSEWVRRGRMGDGRR